METRVCKKCGIKKPLSEYESEIKNGKEYFRWICKDCRKNKKNEYNKNYKRENTDKRKETSKNWFCKNKEKIYRNRKEKRENDEIYRYIELLRNRVGKVFRKRGHINSEYTEKMLGCTNEYFYHYLLNTYERNYGERYNEKQDVNIDHIIPLSTAKTKEDVYRLFHYRNLQLLKAVDNREKWHSLSWSSEDRN